jgi:hypothetical protein
MNQELCFGQRIDPELGILEPWYTNPCMDRIKEWDLSDKVVWEYGSGSSTVWWGMKAKQVLAVDHNEEGFGRVIEMLEQNRLQGKVMIKYVPTHEGDTSENRDDYIEAYADFPDIVIVDGVHRYECAEHAIKVLQPKILIIDNHQQDYVFICPALDVLTKGLKMERFIQPDHKDHEGNPWATAIFYL